jgi:hypothetical protein
MRRKFDQGLCGTSGAAGAGCKRCVGGFRQRACRWRCAISKELPCYMLFGCPLRLTDAETMDAQLRQLFGLTASKALFVLALSKQSNPARAASDVGIAESTGRTRLQSIFDKTGVHRQAYLRLLTDALAEALT